MATVMLKTKKQQGEGKEPSTIIVSGMVNGMQLRQVLERYPLSKGDSVFLDDGRIEVDVKIKGGKRTITCPDIKIGPHHRITIIYI